MTAMRDDLNGAIRSLRSSWSVTVAAFVVLTLAIGATTAIFSVVDAVVLLVLSAGLAEDPLLLPHATATKGTTPRASTAAVRRR